MIISFSCYLMYEAEESRQYERSVGPSNVRSHIQTGRYFHTWHYVAPCTHILQTISLECLLVMINSLEASVYSKISQLIDSKSGCIKPHNSFPHQTKDSQPATNTLFYISMSIQAVLSSISSLKKH
jgi:hypothetical protein